MMSWLQRRLAAGQDHGNRLVGRRLVTPTLLLAVAIGLADVLFAVDSIPAVFGITTSASLVVACNVFALMGLRQLYALLARVLDRIVYLDTGLGIICAFVGVKLLLQALHGSGAGWAPEIPAWLSVIVVVAVLLFTVLAGTMRGRPMGQATRNPASMTVTEGVVTDGRTQLAAGERAMLARRFAVLDIDGNGVWQRADYQRLTRRLCETFGHPADSAAGQAVAMGQRALFDALLSHMDADGDQEITRDEFIAALGRAIEDRPGFDAAVRTAADALVQAADQDGNGALDAGEYARLAAAYGARADEAAQAFGRLDRDRNGMVDIAELALAISQFFTSRDAGAYGNLAFGHL